ncbi:hypothetical protein [Arthrobacter pityocampae]|uniref:hypothetical protein n=1 Tax=Arthrobacter pityocampae TaxID=547334 RepID=UPI0037351A8C
MGKLTFASTRKWATVALTVAFMGLTASPANAVESDENVINRIQAITEDTRNGYVSDEDRQWLAGHPDIASSLVDPAATTPLVKITPGSKVPQGSTDATRCVWSDRQVVYKSFTGGVVYRYHNAGNLCWTGYSSSVSGHYGYFDDVSVLYQVRNGSHVNQVISSGTAKTLHTQGYIDQCVAKYGCFSAFYPWNKTTIYANGAQSFQYGE